MNPGINSKELHSKLSVTIQTIERWIKELRDKNIIEFRGAAKTGGYYISEKNN